MSLLPIVVSSICTSIGALPVLFIKNLSHKGKDVTLAFTAGIMVAASSYGLIPSAIKLSDITTLVIGILIGTFVLTLIESVIPHTDLDHSKHPVGQAHVLLFMIAMSIHNFPEGLSVGISNVSSNLEVGSLVAFAIGLQNIPEGFLVTLFLVTQGINRLKAILFSAVTGLIELFAGMFGYLFGEFFQPVVPYGLAFAAGSMLFVVYKELIPESHGDGNERASTITFILGFITMICLTEFFR
ncbi:MULTISPECIES: ZIP family metal transporter [Bacillaceae]|uniref:ZIP family metal transporter n=1 Tax=Bacillaceae TaxID=186817 RepID=UPI000BFBE587|nr:MULTISPECIES: ZIP family metal transporter [Bacillaceae]PGT80599.1 ZIP family metal transporter [Bacillus sp. AFS040349]UGB28868.1 ZIP family metal transporter [Metabacillus sp. B2-18]